MVIPKTASMLIVVLVDTFVFATEVAVTVAVVFAVTVVGAP